MSSTGLPAARPPAGWRRWRMETFDPAPAGAPADEPAGPPPAPDPGPGPDPEQRLAQALAQARAEGLAAGRREGLEAGRREGLQAGREAGHAEGLQAGREQGLEEGRRLAAEEARRMAALADACAAALQSLEEDVGQALLALALDVARRMAGAALQQPPASLPAAVRETLRAASADEGVLRLWVHPDDLPLVERHLREDPAAGDWRVLADDALLRGGCRAETAFGAIDATLQTRWRRIAASLGCAGEWEGES